MTMSAISSKRDGFPLQIIAHGVWPYYRFPLSLRLVEDGKAVMLSRRFDRNGAIRIPFLSAMAMMGAKDGERGSYPEIVDALAQHGAQGKTDAHALYRRVVFNVLISNVDHHLRNHGFLWLGKAGWSLSPAYDLA
ncbi:serine/threonine protein kinase HipA of HipAB toxin-antitoxin module [Neorhizobium galegae]|nr:serine/threonine protein kinase HipA of HipAB toxin-antitoxin module [Neorhizobium galegae]